MMNQAIDTIDTTTFHRTLQDAGPPLEQLARGVDTQALHMNPGSVVLGLIFCSMVLFCGYFMSHSYAVAEREELAEAERNRVAAEKEKIQQQETYRSKITKILESYAIHLTNMTSRSSVLSMSSRHNASMAIADKDIARTIPNGTDDDDVPMESITITSDSSADLEDVDESREEIDEEDVDVDDDSIIESLAEEACTTLRSTLTIDTRDRARDADAPPMPSCSSITSTITRANLREAVTYNPCPICLEPFKAGDDIVCCSNNVDGQKPHVFHQECSLDYILTHAEGIQAPCPCCRNVLLPSEEQQQRNKGCFKHSHRSALTLPDLAEPDEDELSTPTQVEEEC